MAKLFYVIGPSGAGKDSVIDKLKQQRTRNLVFAHRYITRSADAGGENYIELSLNEFELRQSLNLFSMHWQANNHCYGVGCEVDSWLGQRVDVVVNGSRGYLEQALERYGEVLIPVVIDVSNDVLEKRLRIRGRESDDDIEQRLKRANEFRTISLPENALILDNSGSLTDTVNQFLEQMVTA
nr:ribose 1,5-bisphosphokinase [uncultured Vibrio sp.]